MPRVDDYLLGRSSSFPLVSAEEDRSDLILTQSAPARGRVRGRVTNAVDGSRIADATVKLRSLSGDPVAHTLTNPAGNYIIEGIRSGTYIISAVYSGFLTAVGRTFTIHGGRTVDINITLSPDTQPQNVVFGVVTSQVTGETIDNALVALVPDLTSPDDISVVRSNEDGEFLISGIPDSEQTLVSGADGYYESLFVPLDISGGTPIRSDIALQPYSLPRATINGYIRNTDNSPIANAFVGLYMINGQGVEVLQQVTYTDANGFYIFGRAVSGTYVIKSKLEKVVTDT